jgi:hypothetical protein
VDALLGESNASNAMPTCIGGSKHVGDILGHNFMKACWPTCEIVVQVSEVIEAVVNAFAESDTVLWAVF